MKNRCGQVPLWGEFGACFAPGSSWECHEKPGDFFLRFFFHGNPARIPFEIYKSSDTVFIPVDVHVTIFLINFLANSFSPPLSVAKNPTNGFPHVWQVEVGIVGFPPNSMEVRETSKRAFMLLWRAMPSIFAPLCTLVVFTTWLRKWYWLLTRDAYCNRRFDGPFLPRVVFHPLM